MCIAGQKSSVGAAFHFFPGATIRLVNVFKGVAMDKTLALLDCLAQLKEAQNCADALLSGIVAEAVRANKGRGGVPDPATLKAFRNALKSANSHCYQAELILAEFDVRQPALPPSPARIAFYHA